MASTKYYITAGLPPNDTADDGSTKFYITAGLPPATTEAAPSRRIMIIGWETLFTLHFLVACIRDVRVSRREWFNPIRWLQG